MKLLRFSYYALFLLLFLFSQLSLAGALDRSRQSIDVIFADKPTVELIHTDVNPRVNGVDSLNQKIDGIVQPFTMTQLNVKTLLAQSYSLALIIDQPWGGDFVYADNSLLYGGTLAKLESLALTGLVKKQLNNRSSLYAGLRFQEVSGQLSLDGLAFGPLAGYTLNSEKDWASGYVLGGSYSIKEYGARLSLSYQSETDHTVDTEESNSPTSTQAKIITPQSVNIGIRTGINPKTLLFSTFRWVDWDQFVFDAEGLDFEIVSFSDTKTYQLGVAHQLSPNWLTTAVLRYEPKVAASGSLFQPTNGYKGLAVGAAHTINPQLRVTGIYSYTQVGDANAQTQGGNGVSFRDNSTKAINLRIRWLF